MFRSTNAIAPDIANSIVAVKIKPLLTGGKRFLSKINITTRGDNNAITDGIIMLNLTYRLNFIFGINIIDMYIINGNVGATYIPILSLTHESILNVDTRTAAKN